MAIRRKWTREELLLAISLYSRLPFGRLHSRNSDIVRLAAHLGRTPAALAMKLCNFAAIDPDLKRVGLKAFSLLDSEVWKEYCNSETIILETNKKIQTILQNDVLYEENADYTAENRTEVIQARAHQHFFREMVLSNYAGKCCITGINHLDLLVASHIKPWATDSNNRLNPRNGLCLNALHDKAFDCGLITLDESLKVVISSDVPRTNQLAIILDYEGQAIARPEKFMPDEAFLAYHRCHIFKNG